MNETIREEGEEIQFKKDCNKVEGLVELFNKPPHLWTDEELAEAIKQMKY